MYAKYYTEALVLNLEPSGEADALVSLYTQDFGLVRARAAALRTERSKMRQSLPLYASAFVALVRGKHGWRLAGAVCHGSHISVTEAVVWARIARLVLRLVTGEEKNEELFEILRGAHTALRAERGWVSSIELLCVARILRILGYLSLEAELEVLVNSGAYGQDALSQEETQSALLSSVNRALSETQL